MGSMGSGILLVREWEQRQIGRRNPERWKGAFVVNDINDKEAAWEDQSALDFNFNPDNDHQ